MPELLRASPAKIVQQLLINLGLCVAPGTSGANVWPVYAPRKPGGTSIPDNIVVVFNTSGEVGKRDHVSQTRSVYHGLQTWLRSRDVNVGDLKLRSIAEAFDKLPPDKEVTVSGRTYSVQLIKNTTDVLDIGTEGENSSLNIFTLNSLISVYDVNN